MRTPTRALALVVALLATSCAFATAQMEFDLVTRRVRPPSIARADPAPVQIGGPLPSRSFRLLLRSICSVLFSP
jgi:hypothetical protein